jgi:transposase
MILVGIDWAEDHHDVAVMDEQGKVLARERVAEGIKGVGRLHALIGDYTDDPEQVAVGIQTDRGLMAASLVAAGYQVYAINPKAVDRYRDRHCVSGANPIAATPRSWPTWFAPTATTTAASPQTATSPRRSRSPRGRTRT